MSAVEETRTLSVAELTAKVGIMGPREAAELLDSYPNRVVSEVLQQLNPAVAQDILSEFDEERRNEILAAAPAPTSEQWSRNQSYEEGSLGRLMEPPLAVFPPSMSIVEAIAQVRELVKKNLVTYAYVVDPDERLLGVVTMRDLLLSRPEQRLEEVMLRNPFYLRPEIPLTEAMKLVLNRHFPLYPVCDEQGHLLGQVRGQAMFEEQAIEISAQPGTMVGVDREERLSTPW